jgi:low affinity Fe/Cu permease
MKKLFLSISLICFCLASVAQSTPHFDAFSFDAKLKNKIREKLKKRDHAVAVCDPVHSQSVHEICGFRERTGRVQTVWECIVYGNARVYGNIPL